MEADEAADGRRPSRPLPRPDFHIDVSARENSGFDDDVLPSVSTQNSTLGSSMSLPTQRPTAQQAATTSRDIDELPVLLPLRHEMCITSEPRYVTCNRPWYGPCERRTSNVAPAKHSCLTNGIMKKLHRDRCSHR
ncbi:Hypothetical predicted protein [Cloeon dipterum]|uniref:Uncharacterized protein n=1 Tax=Cloeon dipterum TaxID=197152 RepID=A0A8S1CCS0_9INSE|nr:Hypothetical predicted protein [Cloeon dipterum]